VRCRLDGGSVSDAVGAIVSDVYRDEWGRIVASLIGTFGDWDLAEECAQEAFTQALRSWPTAGVPTNPGAWLTTVARNRALDRLRRRATEARKLEDVAGMQSDEHQEPGPEEPTPAGDDRLRLIFTCCHPRLPLEGRVALTLRALGGLTTAEIGRAFLVSEPTMAKRLVRAKHRIREDNIPYEVPAPDVLTERLSGVLAVLYLIFSEGYAGSGQAFVRDDLCAEAIRLTRTLVRLVPDNSEALGLLALELLQNARRATRIDANGALVPLEEQDRSHWDAGQIEEALTLLEETPSEGRFGSYQLQAAIAACHSTASSAQTTDWPALANLYAQLLTQTDSPIVRLNAAIAIGMADGPAVGLAALSPIEDAGELKGYHLLPAARADFERRLGMYGAAAESYRAALEGAVSEPERRYLERRLAEIANLGQ
jgi:RNA polymerase sigma-70 factor, ECF subfamily